MSACVRLITIDQGYRPFVEACVDADEKGEALKYITKAIQGFKIDNSSSGEVVSWDPRPPNFAHCNDPNVVGLDKQIEDLVQRVRGEELHRVVSIIGMAGLGKTTLAKKVYNTVQQSFDCSAWIVVSQHPNRKELLRDIAGQVGLPENEMKHNVEANLYAFLCTRRYVITIDDIWDIKAWNALKPGLPIDSEKGSRIILGSRNKNVGKDIGGPDSVFELQPLDLQANRELFYKLIAHVSENITETLDPPQLENIGEQILER
ncbi:hypothetical protein Vadar_011688 [Vaccinium darrowii]|uniref:Uncharacterized protein n=1 Tax=Vaccinium darrowii TaxID=229202 RepID=A0ACB7WZY3_9ERIC|nr:hypothetical protein Vadar_011688 [Vaccinium darrowii]